MPEPTLPNPTRPQADRLARFAAEESVDVHCHCLPGLDDGPATMADALAVCRALVADGITTVIATPHQLGTYEASNLAPAVRAAVAALSAHLAAEGVPLRVVPGGDVRVDERLMAKAAPDAVFMHCLPAHRGEEVTAGVIDGPQSVVFDGAENRLHAQKGVLAWSLGAAR